jgi:hypothetical protein
MTGKYNFRQTIAYAAITGRQKKDHSKDPLNSTKWFQTSGTYHLDRV